MKVGENVKNDSMKVKMNQFDLCEAHFQKQIVLISKANCFDWKWVEQTQFCKNFEREIEFTSDKNEVSGWVKVNSLWC